MEIVEALRYCPSSGNLYWKIDRPRGVTAGDVAGSKNHDGYLRVSVFGKTYQAHRLAWFIYYGELPILELDHINRTRSDNRITNLREVTRVGNCLNVGRHQKNSTGFTGVVRHKTGKYQAQIKTAGTCIYLGLYDNPESASAAYQLKRKEIKDALK